MGLYLQGHRKRGKIESERQEGVYNIDSAELHKNPLDFSFVLFRMLSSLCASAFVVVHIYLQLGDC